MAMCAYYMKPGGRAGHVRCRAGADGRMRAGSCLRCGKRRAGACLRCAECQNKVGNPAAPYPGYSGPGA